MAVRRRRRRVAEVEEESFVLRCIDWLVSEEGEAAARRAIGRSALPLEPFDLTAEITLKVLDKARRDADHFLAEEFRNGNPANYCAKAMRHYVIDLVRGRERWRAAERLLEADARLDDGTWPGPDARGSERAAMEVEAMRLVDDLRIDAEYSGAGAIEVSGALTVWVLQGDPDADTGDAPRPLAGAKPEHARLWPALWFAGVRDKAFPTDGPATAAQNTYRNRKVKPIARLVHEIVTRRLVEGESEDPDESHDGERGS